MLNLLEMTYACCCIGKIVGPKNCLLNSTKQESVIEELGRSQNRIKLKNSMTMQGVQGVMAQMARSEMSWVQSAAKGRNINIFSCFGLAALEPKRSATKYLLYCCKYT